MLSALTASQVIMKIGWSHMCENIKSFEQMYDYKAGDDCRLETCHSYGPTLSLPEDSPESLWNQGSFVWNLSRVGKKAPDSKHCQEQGLKWVPWAAWHGVVLNQLPFEVKCIFLLDIYCVGSLDGF